MKILWLVYIFSSNFVNGERILALFPNSAKSHFFTFEPLFVKLASRGHHVVILSPFPQKYKIENYTEIFVPENDRSIQDFLNLSEYNPSKFVGHNNMILIYAFFENFAELDILVLEKMIQLLNNKYKFDLIMTELFNTDLFLGFAHKYQAPIIALSSSSILPWGTDRFGIPDNPSYIPYSYFSNSHLMSFKQRLSNFYSTFLLKTVYKQKYLKKTDQIARKYFGENMPPLDELIKNTSLMLVNTHYSINNMPRPFPPQVVEVAGLHITSVKPLTQEINKFITESEHGIIYFSFGSLVKSSTMSGTTLRVFCDVFSELPQRVLWKWEETEMPGKPENVKIVQWAPQRDILAHSNIRMFISHGGLLGIIEAIDSGVPVLGIPFYGDQMQNVENLVQSNAAIRLDYLNISIESLSYAVNSLLDDKKYKENSLRLSHVFKDRPQKPLETAVYWTEYVLRHRGAHHLRTAAVHLPWYQYLLLDVIGVLLCICVIAGLILFYSLKAVISMFCVRSKKYKTH